ncbi:NTP transferase domain-containing protein [Frankia sp. Cj3]|uniref:NTP transferase domain-containing protein n=1 Tax=Frankia sp. Cj3 TaxID=2880976 RepID=UPI00351CD194
MTGAIVLAAGPGTRLGDLGARMPKTMLPVAGRPYLEHLVCRLLRQITTGGRGRPPSRRHDPGTLQRRAFQG